MDNLLKMLEDMALNGYGVVWSNVHNDYRPFEIDAKDDTFYWWHDPCGCANINFEAAVHATHEKMLSWDHK